MTETRTHTTNPHGANASTSDPREQVMWDIYVKNLAEGVENAYRAAKEAGYEEATSRQITVRSWFLERKSSLERKEMLSDAEKVLRKTLRYSTEDDEGKVKVDLLKVQVDASKHVTNALGDKVWSKKENTDLTSQGEKISFAIVKYTDDANTDTSQVSTT